jgi:ABC-type branched-subunit amino acid transport system substrate-binding protein
VVRSLQTFVTNAPWSGDAVLTELRQQVAREWGDPEAVVMVGTYKPCAEFIKLAKRIKLDAVFVNISFVGSNALAEELGEDGKGVVVTQVVPLPTDTDIALVAQYQR